MNNFFLVENLNFTLNKVGKYLTPCTFKSQLQCVLKVLSPRQL